MFKEICINSAVWPFLTHSTVIYTSIKGFISPLSNQMIYCSKKKEKGGGGKGGKLTDVDLGTVRVDPPD